MTTIEVSFMHFTPNNLSSSYPYILNISQPQKPIKPNTSNPHTQ